MSCLKLINLGMSSTKGVWFLGKNGMAMAVLAVLAHMALNLMYSGTSVIELSFHKASN